MTLITNYRIHAIYCARRTQYSAPILQQHRGQPGMKIGTRRARAVDHLVFSLILTLALACSTASQTSTISSSLPEDPGSQSQPPTGGADAHELAKKLSNPVASLISFPFQSNFDFGMGTGSGWRYTLNIQPVVPFRLTPKWNLISRTILPVIHQRNVASIGTQSGLGDTTQSFFFSPAEEKRLIWAVGPAMLIPTATDDFLGTGRFGVGPTFLALKQQSGWTYGALTNHIWSVAGDDDRAKVNSTFLQPFLAYNTKDAWTYTINTESSYDWIGNNWSVPINFTITRLTKFGAHPVSLGGGIKCWAHSGPGGPENCGVRIVVTPLFPR